MYWTGFVNTQFLSFCSRASKRCLYWLVNLGSRNCCINNTMYCSFKCYISQKYSFFLVQRLILVLTTINVFKTSFNFCPCDLKFWWTFLRASVQWTLNYKFSWYCPIRSIIRQCFFQLLSVNFRTKPNCNSNNNSNVNKKK